MAKDVTLTDINGEKIYPKTYMKNVYNTDGQKTVSDIINDFSMCPAGGKYIQVSIKSYTSVNDVVFTAPDNGYATIRGNFSGSWAYCIKDGGGSFYQWASASGSPFFPLRKGANILINYVTGTMSWADLYFVSAKQI